MLAQGSHSTPCLQRQTCNTWAFCSSLRHQSQAQKNFRLHQRSCNSRLSLSRRKQTLQASAASTSQKDEPQTIPYGYEWYETMMLLRPNLDEEARDMELAKFEAFLQKENAVGIDVLVRGNNQALAYPIKGYWDGIYVLYTYASLPATVKGVQRMLTTPGAGTVSNILRHMTHRLS